MIVSIKRCVAWGQIKLDMAFPHHRYRHRCHRTCFISPDDLAAYPESIGHGSDVGLRFNPSIADGGKMRPLNRRRRVCGILGRFYVRSVASPGPERGLETQREHVTPPAYHVLHCGLLLPAIGAHFDLYSISRLSTIVAMPSFPMLDQSRTSRDAQRSLGSRAGGASPRVFPLSIC